MSDSGTTEDAPGRAMTAAPGRTRAAPHPSESYVRPPSVAPSPTDHVFGPEHMVQFYDAPGEYGLVLEGKDHGFSALSLITTDTQPGGGPPLHSHDVEEAYLLLEGRCRVLIGDRRLDVQAPAAVRVPAGVPHTFVNTSDRVIDIIGVLPRNRIGYTELGPNPLLNRGAEGEDGQ